MTTKIFKKEEKLSKRSKRIQEGREKIFSPEKLEEINNKNLEKEKNYRDNFDLKQRFDEAAKMEKNDRMKVIQEENALNLDVVMECAEVVMELSALSQQISSSRWN